MSRDVDDWATEKKSAKRQAYLGLGLFGEDTEGSLFIFNLQRRHVN